MADDLFLRDLWYFGARSATLKRGQMRREMLLGEPVMIGRKNDGSAGMASLPSFCLAYRLAEKSSSTARAAGKRGPEVRESIQAAMKLTDAQKAKLAEGRKAMGTLNKEIMGKVKTVLTPEQQDVLKKAHANRGSHRNHGNGGNSQPPSQVN